MRRWASNTQRRQADAVAYAAAVMRDGSAGQVATGAVLQLAAAG